MIAHIVTDKNPLSAPKHMPSFTRFVGVACIVACIVGVIGVRIWWVNDNALSYPVVHHAMNEWVKLDGAFLNYLAEDTNGYAIRVTEAVVMSPNEYIELYGEDPSYTPDNLDADRPSILCLTLEVQNGANETGGFFIQGFLLAPISNPVRYVYDAALWHESNRNIDATTLFLRVIPGTSFTLHVPFVQSNSPETIDDTSFSFVVSTVPVRHVIDVEASTWAPQHAG